MIIVWTAAGLSLFSFVNVLVWRLPRNMNFLTDRSRCLFCGQTLNWRDLIPVFSWLLLKGRCRYCGEKIPLRYLLTELWGGFCSLLCVKCWGISWKAGEMLVFLALLLTCPVWAAISYEEKLSLRVGYLFLSFRLFPPKEKKKPEKQKK